MTEYRSVQVDRLINALRLLHHPNCLLENIPNPCDEPCQFIAALISRKIDDLESWKSVFEEYLAYEIQAHRSTLEDLFFSGSIDGLDKWNIDPAKELHVLEQDNITISDQWKPDVMKCQGIQSFYFGCNTLISYLFKGESLDSIWPDWKEMALLVVFQESRTDRYLLDKKIDSIEPKWLKIPKDGLPSLQKVLISSMRKFYRNKLQHFQYTRSQIARERVIDKAAEILANCSDDQAVMRLSELQVNVMNCNAKLQREDTLAVLKSKLLAGKISAALTVLVCGKWTSSPPSDLFKFRHELAMFVKESERAELHASLMRTPCLRDHKSTNRHGHSIVCQKPPLLDFTEEYASARLQGLRKKKRLERVKEYLAKIRAFIIYSQWVNARVVELSLSDNISSIARNSIDNCLDASLLPKIQKKLQGYLGIMPTNVCT